MESQDNLPENIKILIQRAVARNSRELDLRNSGLNDSIIKNVLIKIKEKLPNLQKLYLSDNQITAVPPEIGKLKYLKQLYLHNTPLTQLPSEIGNLTNLLGLHLENTQLTQLPSEIGNLTNLRFLHLQNTPLTQLPSEIGNLTNLIYLDSQNTQITAVPSGIGNLEKLESLNLTNTPLSLKSMPILSKILSKLELGDLEINNDQRQVLDNIRKEGYSSIVSAFADTYPDISAEDFNTFFLRLSSDQVRGIVDFEVPLEELGIGFDEEGEISTELEVHTPTIELNNKIDRIKKSNPDISNEEALNLTKNTEEQTLHAIYDFGLTLSQASKIDSQEMRIDVYKLLIEKIATENHDNETPDIGELTDADKNLARESFDQIIDNYKSQQKEASNVEIDFAGLAISPSDTVGDKGHDSPTSPERKPSQKEGVKPRGPKMG